ncbi:MAG: hypothetical protein Q9196_006662, partial [Gyalolechia fulgens]
APSHPRKRNNLRPKSPEASNGTITRTKTVPRKPRDKARQIAAKAVALSNTGVALGNKKELAVPRATKVPRATRITQRRPHGKK